MKPRAGARILAAIAVWLWLWPTSGCSLVAPFRLGDLAEAGGDADGDADGDEDGEVDEDSDLDAAVDVEADAEESPADADEDDVEPLGPGPMTWVIRTATLTEDRVCDLDGDGAMDNAIADLGAAAPAAAVAFNAAVSSWLGFIRYVVHVPYVEDRDRPHDRDIVAILFRGEDLDWDPADDFSGEEPFWVPGRDLDACGEPLFAFLEAEIDDGVFDGSDGTAFIHLGDTPEHTVPLRRASATGAIAPRGGAATVRLCGAATIADLGPAPGPPMTVGLSMLEAFVAGATAFGYPGLPGLAPDVDLDGDGLEQILLDDELHVEVCIDGDGTYFRDPACWEDEAFADAFSITLDATATSAVFAGRHPWWELEVDGECEAPPEPSLFDPV